MTFKIALAQIAPQLGDIEANCRLHLDTIREAAAAGAELVVFPELSLTGYALGARAFDVALDMGSDVPVLGALLAASQGIDVVFSFVERDERERIYISAIYASGGQVVHRHRKIYLPTYGLFEEGKYFAPGQDVRAFDTRFGRLGLLICEDLWHMSLPYLLWQDGADALILLSSSLEHGLGSDAGSTADRVTGIGRTYATLFTTFVIHVNRAGVEDEAHYWGGSTVFNPQAILLAQGPINEPALIVADIDMSELALARRRLPLLRDERPDLTARVLERIRGEHG